MHQKTLDLSWTMKFLMGKTLIQWGEEHEAILLTLDEILANQQKMAIHLGIQLNLDKENTRTKSQKRKNKSVVY